MAMCSGTMCPNSAGRFATVIFVETAVPSPNGGRSSLSTAIETCAGIWCRA